MDWNNINLKDNYERNQNIIDPLSFDTLLLEISCNVREINKENVLKQFETDLKSRIESAREIMLSNLDNIVKDAQEYRNND
jgi:hypothetical protein